MLFFKKILNILVIKYVFIDFIYIKDIYSFLGF